MIKAHWPKYARPVLARVDAVAESESHVRHAAGNGFYIHPPTYLKVFSNGLAPHLDCPLASRRFLDKRHNRRQTRGHCVPRGARSAIANGTDHRRQVRRSGDCRTRRGLASPAITPPPAGRNAADVAAGRCHAGHFPVRRDNSSSGPRPATCQRVFG